MGHRHSSKTGMILPVFYSTPMILLVTQRGAFLRLCMERKHATVSVLKLNELGGEKDVINSPEEFHATAKRICRKVNVLYFLENKVRELGQTV